MTEKKRALRLPPCPKYDVEGTQRWLDDLAAEGLFLTEDGFFGGVGHFERREPKKVRHRLAAAPKTPSFWAADGGEPAPEQVELAEKYQWEYVAARGEFYVYRTDQPGARELETDSELKALSLKGVRKRQRANLLTLLFWLVIYFPLVLRGGLVRAMVELRTWVILLGLALGLSAVAGAAAAMITTRRLEKKVKAGEPLSGDTDWKKRAPLNYAKGAAELVLLVAFIGALLQGWAAEAGRENYVPVDQYGQPPFATVADLLGGGEAEQRWPMSGLTFNTVKVWSDLIAPENLDWCEQCDVTRPDGETVSGLLDVEYHRMRTPWLARRLAKEYVQYERWRKIGPFSKDLTELEAPETDVDFIACYRDQFHNDAVVFCKGSTVVWAQFHQYQGPGERDPVRYEDWVKTLIDSVV